VREFEELAAIRIAGTSPSIKPEQTANDILESHRNK
jgi:hypothetical protein